MRDQTRKLGTVLASAVLFAGLAGAAHADIDSSGSGIPSSANVELSSGNAILPGSLNTSAPVPTDTADTLTASLGIPNAMLDHEFNIFNVNPAQITEWGTAYGEVWNGSGSQWGGVTVGAPMGRLGVFLGRPYTGVAGSIGQPVGTTPTGKADASATPVFTGIQNGAAGAWLGTLSSDPAALLGHALYDFRALAPRNLIDLFYGIALGDNLSVGLGYAYAVDKDEETWSETRVTATTPNTVNDGSISNERKTADHQISVGALVKNVGPLQKVDLAFSVNNMKVDNKHSETRLNANGTTAATANSSFESDGAMSFGFIFRTMMGIGEKNKAIAAISFDRPNTSSQGSFKVDTDGNGTTTNIAADIDRTWKLEDKSTNFRFDTAFHQMPTSALKLIYSLSYVRVGAKREFTLNENNNNVSGATGTRDKETREETASGLPVGIAVEHQTFSKMTTRFGVRKTLFGKNNVEVTDTTNRVAGGAFQLDQTAKRETKIDASLAATATLGLGFQPTKDVDIDFALVSNLFDLDAGAGVSDIITRASLRYHF